MKKAQYAYFLIPYIVPYLVGEVPHIIQKSIIWGTFFMHLRAKSYEINV